MTTRRFLAAVLMASPTLVCAQATTPPASTVAIEFPPGAETMAEDAIRARFSGKVVRMQFAAGPQIRIDVRANGYMHGDASTGWRDTGRWHVKGSAWCDDWQRSQTAGGCNEVRLADGMLLLKRRSNGEIVAIRE